MKTYWVAISVDNGRNWGPRVGWDKDYPTREEAEECAERARQQDGWMAAVRSQDA
jgi:hypothetical protein